MTCPRHQLLARLADGRVAAGRRDASFYDPDRRVWAVHVALEVPSGRGGPGPVPACDTLRGYLADEHLVAAAAVPADQRCGRAACVRWWRAIEDTGT